MKYIHQKLFLIASIFCLSLITQESARQFSQEDEFYQELEQLEKVEHQVDTMTCIQGTYISDGIIETIDGNVWEIDNSELNIQNNTDIIVYFQTYNMSPENWEIIDIITL